MRGGLILGGLNGAVAVALGAYAAHGIADPHAADLARQGAAYQLLHAVLIVAIAACIERRASGWLWIALILVAVGTILFSGALYSIALFGVSLGPVAPTGGIGLILGWLCLIPAAYRR